MPEFPETIEPKNVPRPPDQAGGEFYESAQGERKAPFLPTYKEHEAADHAAQIAGIETKESAQGAKHKEIPNFDLPVEVPLHERAAKLGKLIEMIDHPDRNLTKPGRAHSAQEALEKMLAGDDTGQTH